MIRVTQQANRGMRCRWSESENNKARVMTGKHQEQDRDNETDARQVWRKRQVGEEHKNTGRKQSRRHFREQDTGKNKR